MPTFPDLWNPKDPPAALDDCRSCDLWRRATRPVPGEGPSNAKVMFAGEQPGPAEDHAGRPFVGPAGRLLDRAIGAAGIDRRVVYVTNIMKHFKWEPRGQRRLPSRPTLAEVHACLPWIEAEIEELRPEYLVCLGATAARALLGPHFRITAQRGKWVPSPFASNALATVHPSTVLREQDDERRREAFDWLVADLALVAERLSRP